MRITLLLLAELGTARCAVPGQPWPVAARAIVIRSFDEESNWWVSKLLKKPIGSTVLPVDWHPNNVLPAASSAYVKTRVFPAYIKDMDGKSVLFPLDSHPRSGVKSSRSILFVANSLVLLEAERTPFLSLHLRTLSHSQASRFCSFPYKPCWVWAQRSRQHRQDVHLSLVTLV